MANLIRLAKLGSSWGRNELDAYNIAVVEQEQELFFGGPFPAYLPAYTGLDGFTTHENRVQELDESTLSLMKRLDLAMRVVEGEESAVDDFVVELLRVLKYETKQTVIRTRKTPDICILDPDSGILLLAQEDKSHINLQDPEAQLIAEAIAAFQTNNKKRTDQLFLDPLEEWLMTALDEPPTSIFPGITMFRTFPRFYKIRVTAELDQCVRHGTYPATKTTVYRHTPRVPGRSIDGMKPLDNRKHILQCYEAFKRFVLPGYGLFLSHLGFFSHH
ncbi:hypothetical protein BD779DRAFT_1613824 [Infundibulicybe gibba]|nr:hypothetical protein BD779DRAFT_1613824 [Infundibulicybe gibba]